MVSQLPVVVLILFKLATVDAGANQQAAIHAFQACLAAAGVADAVQVADVSAAQVVPVL